MGIPQTNAGGFASGLMHLSTVAMAADAADAGQRNGSSSSSENCYTSNAVTSSPTDAMLPSGWHRIVHGSGLSCYIHEELGVVSWTRPYTLDLGSENLSRSEMYNLVKQHVPPLSIFGLPSKDVPKGKVSENNSRLLVDGASTMMQSLQVQQQQGPTSKKRKLTPIEEGGRQKSMTLDEFKTLPIGDPRILQVCMELSVKTPAQVLQEYQNRNRGVSINYNTVPIENDGVKLFKTIVTAGNTVAEGVASTKKIAKQLGAQQLLAMLHERTAQTYYEVAELYNNVLKGQPVITESSTYGPPAPVLNDSKPGRSSNVDYLVQRGGNSMRRSRKLPPNQDFDGGYREVEFDRRMNAPSHWSATVQHVPQSAAWVEQRGIGINNAGPDRVVVYSQGSDGNYNTGQYFNASEGSGNNWSGYSNVSHTAMQLRPSGTYTQQYNGTYNEALGSRT